MTRASESQCARSQCASGVRRTAARIGVGLGVASLVGLLAACDPGAPGVVGVAQTGQSTALFSALDRENVSAGGGGPKRRAVIKNPTPADLAKAGPLGDRAMGRKDAPVTVVEYASLTCPYCAAFHRKTWPTFKRRYIDTGKVRYILREFPIGRSSGNAWLVTRCAPASKFFALYDAYLKRQSLWVSQEVRTEKIFQVARAYGMTRGQFDACLKNQDVIDHIKWVKDRGRELGVIGTPTFFINAKQHRSVLTIDDLARIIDPQLG